MKEIVVIIPARGGSKRVPRKNTRLLAGKPLIAYSIETAVKCSYIARVFVSTEDKEIAEISRKYGADVIERPKELAEDNSPTIETIFHALNFLKGKRHIPNIVVLLQPTSPLRHVEDLNHALELFQTNVCESLISVCEAPHSPYWIMKIEDRYLKSLFGKKYLKMRSQDLPTFFVPNGAIFISTPANLSRFNGFYSDKTLPFEMPVERSIDIDTELDFKLARLILEGGK